MARGANDEEYVDLRNGAHGGRIVRLSAREFAVLQRAILEIHENLDLKEFYSKLPGIMMKLIPCDHFSVMEFEFDAAMRVRATATLESSALMNADLMERMERFGTDHPFTRYSLQTQDPTALKFSDFYSPQQWHRSQLYNEFYRQAGVEHLLGVMSFASKNLTTLNLARPPRTRDFNDRERAFLNVLRPHFDQAVRKARQHRVHGDSARRPLEDYGLSPREAEVARWLAQGKTNVEIAVILQMRVRTVEKHVERILDRFAVENRTVAALLIASASDHAPETSSGPDPRTEFPR